MAYHPDLPEPTPHEADDIQQAIHQAHSSAGEARDSHRLDDHPPREVLSHRGALTLPYPLARLGIQVQRYPWQSLAAMTIAIGCGWVCVYFGFTVLAGFMALAIYTHESDSMDV